MINDTILPIAVARIDRMRSEDAEPFAIIQSLEASFGAKAQFRSGTHELRIAGLKVTSTTGWGAVLSAWRDRAQRRLIEQAFAK